MQGLDGAFPVISQIRLNTHCAVISGIAQPPQPVQPLIKVPPFPGRTILARPCLCS